MKAGESTPFGKDQPAGSDAGVFSELPEAEALRFVERVLAFQDGALCPAQLSGFNRELCESAQKRRLFVETQIHAQRLLEVFRRQAFDAAKPAEPPPRELVFELAPLPRRGAPSQESPAQKPSQAVRPVRLAQNLPSPKSPANPGSRKQGRFGGGSVVFALLMGVLLGVALGFLLFGDHDWF